MDIIRNRLILEKNNCSVNIDLSSSEKIYNFLKKYIKLDKEPEEVLFLICLNNKSQLVNCFEVSRGTLTESITTPREVLKRAIISNVKNIVIAHNHISGNVIPSEKDIDFTKKINKACDIVDLKLLDHIIVGNDMYYSFFDNNYKFLNKKNIERC